MQASSLLAPVGGGNVAAVSFYSENKRVHPKSTSHETRERGVRMALARSRGHGSHGVRVAARRSTAVTAAAAVHVVLAAAQVQAFVVGSGPWSGTSNGLRVMYELVLRHSPHPTQHGHIMHDAPVLCSHAHALSLC